MVSLNTYYRSILPEKSGSFEEEGDNCIKAIGQHLTISGSQLFKLTIFLYSENEFDFKSRKKSLTDQLKNTFGSSIPALSFISQTPLTKAQLCIEAGFVKTAQCVNYKTFEDIHYSVIQFDEYKEIWVSGVGDEKTDQDIHQQSIAAFEKMHRILQAEGMSFNHVVRQWNYIGEILKISQSSEGCCQNYQAFNHIRHQYYQKFRTVKNFPAATGIGKTYPGVLIDFMALKSDHIPTCYAIQSPTQKNPYDYSQEVLVGNDENANIKKRPPEFERALLIPGIEIDRVFVSGTASIYGQETIGIEDIHKQCMITVEMIQTLIQGSNLKRFCINREWINAAPEILRVYIKRPKDIEFVFQYCKEVYKDDPMVFIQADICRDNLLVEIEMEMSLPLA